MKVPEIANRKAINSLLFALAGLGVGAAAVKTFAPVFFISALILTLLAIIQGVSFLHEATGRRGMLLRRWFARLGVALGTVSFGVVLLSNWGVSRCGGPGLHRAVVVNNLKTIGLALLDYHELHGCFPPAVIYNAEGRPLYSWRVIILPQLKQQPLYDKFHLDEPWDSPHNRELLAAGVPQYSFSMAGPNDPRLTYIQAFVGPGAAFEGREGIAQSEFTDGMNSTLMAVEGAEAVEWSRPIDVPYSAVTQLPPLGGAFAGERPFSFRLTHDGIHGVFADTRVRSLDRNLPEAKWRALITRNGGEVIADDAF